MFKHKKSLSSTRRDLHSRLNHEDREDAMSWWARAEDEMQDAPDVDRRRVDGLAFAMGVADQDPEPAAALNVMIRAGYALRTTLPELTSRIGRMNTNKLDTKALHDLAQRASSHPIGALEADHFEEAKPHLVEAGNLVGAYTDESFAAIASVEPNFWQAIVSLAAYQFHKNITPVDEQFVDGLLRYGFAVRAFEESVGHRTAVRNSAGDGFCRGRLRGSATARLGA